MAFKSFFNLISARTLIIAMFISAVLAGCRIPPPASGERDAGDSGYSVATLELAPSSTSSLPSPNPPAATQTSQGMVNEPLDYCFAYPPDFKLLINGSQVEVVGPHSQTSPQPGLVWIDVVGSQGRTAQEIATAEVNEFGGTPPQSTVMMGGEEALVLDGMPGQDPIRKVYIIHGDLLYTLSFSPLQSEYASAIAQMGLLFDTVTSSWVWISSGTPCPATH